MAKRALIGATLAVIALATFAEAPNQSTPKAEPRTYDPALYSGSDGLTLDSAVTIEGASHPNLVRAEYDWLREHYPGAKMKLQSLIRQDTKRYDKRTIDTADGRTIQIWFDITQFFQEP
jgi:hypothetical protein